MSAVTDFKAVVSSAIQAEQAQPYDWDLMKHGVHLIELVRSHPDSQPIFEKMFVELVEAGSPGGPFVEFCMHALRWSHVQAAVEKLHAESVSRNDWRTEPYYRRILESFENDWGDANDIYAGYFNPSA